MSRDDELLAAFWAYERALVADDLATLDLLFAPGPDTLRGDVDGLLRGHEQISEFRRIRGGAPVRTIVGTEVRWLSDDAAVIVAVTAPARGGRGLQTQVWERRGGRWLISAAQVGAPPATFDSRVWRVVGSPLVGAVAAGPLTGETVAVKDVFAVAGFATGAGVPAYLAEQPLPRRHATAVSRLLAAGAAVAGIAQTDQLAYSLAGDNPHYGTPPNAIVPGGLPGGSSSGAASAVALGAASIGLATDTAGSIRVPASYQGLWGLRTTHGAVPTDGVVPLAPDFDTIGLLVRSADLLDTAARALVPDCARPLDGTMVGLQHLACEVDLTSAAEAFRIHQAYQAWQAHGAWLRDHPDAVIGPVADRFRFAATITEATDQQAQDDLHAVRGAIEQVLGGATLVLPAASAAAPLLGAPREQVESARAATFRLTCIAGITGRPVVTVPWWNTPAGPVGQSYVGPRGTDLDLIRLASVQRKED